MNVLVACEYSGIVRDAFLRRGHNAWSCDLLPTESGERHFQNDCKIIINSYTWDLVIMHPPCTYLCVSGIHWNTNDPERCEKTNQAVEFVKYLMSIGVKRYALENPISVISSKLRKPDQIIQPWMFGHGETKSTCLWLKNLPKLKSTKVVAGRLNTCHEMTPGPDRWRERSRTYKGIAEAMATQWGIFETSEFELTEYGKRNEALQRPHALCGRC